MRRIFLVLTLGLFFISFYKAVSLPMPNLGTRTFIRQVTLGTKRNNYGLPVGFTFDCTNSCHIVGLGAWNVAGNSQSDCLMLYCNDTDTLMGTVTVSMAGKPTGFVYANFPTPIAVPDGNHYFVSMEVVSNGDFWYDLNTTVSCDPLPGNFTASSSGASAAIGGTSCNPENVQIETEGSVTYGPVNFIFTIP